MKVYVSCEIEAPIAACFEAFTDLNGLEKNVTAIKKIELLTPGSIGVGTRFKETRLMFGKESDEVMEITAFEPPSFLREEARSDGMHYVSDWKFAEQESKTTVSLTFTIKSTTFMGRLMAYFFSLMAGSLRKAFLADMDDLRVFLEQTTVAAL